MKPSMHPARHLLWVLVLFSRCALAAVTVSDDSGRRVTLESPAERIVSLSPHTTELLYAAGAGDRVSGVASYSDYPPAAQRLPQVGDAANLNLESILALKPDLIVAWKSGNVGHQLEQLQRFGIPVFFSEPRRMEDIASNLQRLGRLAGTEAIADAAAQTFLAGYQALRREYSGRTPVRTFYEIWDQPLTTINGEQLISQAIRLCGGRNIFAGLPTLAPVVTREAVVAADPQAIIASGQAVERPEWLKNWEAWPQVTAVRNGQLYVIDPDLVQRQTPRILAGARIMCGQIEQARQALSGRTRPAESAPPVAPP